VQSKSNRLIQKKRGAEKRRKRSRSLKVSLISFHRALCFSRQFVELIVSAIISHKPKRGDGPVRYQVLWSDGSTSFEPVAQLYDTDEDGNFIFNKVLLQYWRLNPSVRLREGFEDPSQSEWEESDDGDDEVSDPSDSD
jgi:hypothetical protein